MWSKQGVLCKAVREVGNAVSKRNTWVLRRVYNPEPTPLNGIQRNPTELPNLQKLKVVDFENNRPAGPIKVILLQDIEGIGHQFDMVEVDRRLARTDLLLTRKAVYASPFDIGYYSEMKEKMADELASRVRIPYELLAVGRQLERLIVPIKVSMDVAWKVDKQIVKTSLRLVGVDMLDDAIYLSEESITGPNFDIEAKLFRFYVVISKKYIIPMIGRISHISVDETKQVLMPESSRQPSNKELSRYGLRQETPYYQAIEIDESFLVWDTMARRATD